MDHLAGQTNPRGNFLESFPMAALAIVHRVDQFMENDPDNRQWVVHQGRNEYFIEAAGAGMRWPTLSDSRTSFSRAGKATGDAYLGHLKAVLCKHGGSSFDGVFEPVLSA